MNPPKTFGVWGNIEKDNFWSILPEIIEWSKNNNLELFFTEKILSDARASIYAQPKIDSKDKIAE